MLKIIATEIKAIIVDIDGVLTDGGFYYIKDGLIAKKFNTRDAGAMILARKKHPTLKFFVLSYSGDEITLKRINDMGFDKPHMLGIDNKLEAFISLCELNDYLFSEVAYIADSIIDIDILQKVGLAVCPADAIEPVKKVCDLILERSGGQGVIEEFLCKAILNKA